MARPSGFRLGPRRRSRAPDAGLRHSVKHRRGSPRRSTMTPMGIIVRLPQSLARRAQCWPLENAVAERRSPPVFTRGATREGQAAGRKPVRPAPPPSTFWQSLALWQLAIPRPGVLHQIPATARFPDVATVSRLRATPLVRNVRHGAPIRQPLADTGRLHGKPRAGMGGRRKNKGMPDVLAASPASSRGDPHRRSQGQGDA